VLDVTARTRRGLGRQGDHLDFNGGESGATVPGQRVGRAHREGTTTVSYFAVDNAGNLETAKTLTVRLDRTRR